jgi:hypothetical protein
MSGNKKRLPDLDAVLAAAQSQGGRARASPSLRPIRLSPYYIVSKLTFLGKIMSSTTELLQELGNETGRYAEITKRKELLVNLYLDNDGKGFLSLINGARDAGYNDLENELKTFSGNHFAKQNSPHKIPGRSLFCKPGMPYSWKPTSSTYEDAAYWRKEGDELLKNVKNPDKRDMLKNMPKKSKIDAKDRYYAILDAQPKNSDRKSTKPTSKRISVPLPLVEEIEARIKNYKKNRE